MEFQRIRRLSLILRWAVAVAAAALVVLLALVLARPTIMTDILTHDYGATSASGITLIKQLLLSALAILALLPSFRALQMLWRLFSLYAEGAVLSAQAAATLKSLGRALLVTSVVTILTPTLAVLIFTFDNPPGAKQLTIQISSAAYALAIFGGLITTIGWAMVEAARVDADNKAII